MPRRLYDDPEYRRRRKQLFASKTKDSLCWRCGEPERPNDPFQCGHLADGQRNSPLAFEHKSCNLSAGGKLAHLQQADPVSKDWTR